MHTSSPHGRTLVTAVKRISDIPVMKYSLRLLCICLLCCASLATAEEKWQRVEPKHCAKALHWKYFEVQWERLLSGKYAELEKEAATPTFADAESCGISPENALFAMFGLEDWRKDPEFNQVFKALDGWDATFPKSPYAASRGRRR